MAFYPKVIAGNKKTGRLVYANNAGDKYEGSHLTSDGEMHHWKFTAKNSAMARQQYEKWCSELDDECAFLAMVERKPLNDSEEHVEEPVEEAMAEVPEEATEETPEEVTEEVPEETYEVMVAPKMGHVYIIWVKAEKPKLYKAYTDMELALRELDTLNEVSAFLGSGEFEIEEVELKC